MTFEWMDLLGWSLDPEVGCWQLMREVHRRLGLRDAPCVPGDPIECAEQYEMVGSGWRTATQLGDVLVSDPRGTGGPSHVAVMVDLRTKTVLSSRLDARGVQHPFTMHAAHASCDGGVWRPKP